MNPLPALRPPTVPHKRGRTVERLAGWLRVFMGRHPNTVWHRVNFELAAETFGLSVRSIYRAKAYLLEHAEFYGFSFVTLRGTRSWECLVALNERLLWDCLPLFFDSEGRPRHVRRWVRGVDELQGARIYSPGEPGVMDSDRCISYARNTADRDINGGIPRRCAVGNQRGDGPEPDTGRRNRYHHALTRRLGRLHWDNCKVNTSHTATLRVVRHALRDGHAPRAIIGAYYSSLVTMHQIATDRGLNEGRPGLRFTVGSTLRRTYLTLGYHECDTSAGKMFVWISPLCG